LIKHARERKGWTQRQVASAIGVTPGFITKVESDQALPSYERCIALAGVLQLPFDTLWVEVEKARVEAHQQSIHTRGAAVRGALYPRSAVAEPSPEASVPELRVEDIAQEMTADPELRAAYRDMQRALADPLLREAVLNALRAFARVARPPGAQPSPS
jgi:transcriptional regulator with XRE-family HTH domain